ncbi:MAG: hypothetical protein Q8942_10880 [Bacillota bacterium]|nr:hypothetical protein [Bacillota bacterium]
MNRVIEKNKKEFLKEYGLAFEKEYYSDEENEKLIEIVFNGEQNERDKILEEYSYDYDAHKSKYKFYKNIPLNCSKDEIDQFIQIKMLEYIKASNESINTIRNIVLCLFFISLIGLMFAILHR